MMDYITRGLQRREEGRGRKEGNKEGGRGSGGDGGNDVTLLLMIF